MTLQHDGLLLLQDKSMRNVVGLITGETLRGSWWSHPRAQEIFACLGRLSDHKDVLVTRLVAGKVTFVHRALWPAFLAVAMANAPWQRHGLSEDARDLLRRMTDSVEASGPAARELQERLLVHADEVHTESGRHELVLQPWTAWAKKQRVKPASNEAAAREELERAVAGIGGKPALLPWHRFTRAH